MESLKQTYKAKKMSNRISVSKLEEYIDFGIVSAVYLVPMPMVPKWALWVSCNNGSELVLTTARGEDRQFASLNTAVELLKLVGWRRPVTLHLD